ncbi:ribonuclease R [Lentimicrobium sp. L6]|uniref:ribonuclease R n=1 Tax=Lentimicrobium sp. L6 TaxID=2735916 RepID=UPI001553C108|nr:ribonuclease R [Lentimicrobium sp. L6]NPD85307.1 ribonuclease R [Lentimicrobium sp. L6]
MKNKNNNTIEKNILKEFANNPFSAFNYKQMSKRLGIKDTAGKMQVLNLILSFFEQKIIVESKRGKFQISPKYITTHGQKQTKITGKVDMQSTGKAYIINDEGGDDISISAGNTKNALHGDKVKVFIFPKRKARKLEGQIVEVLERGKNKFVGSIDVSKNYAFVIPDDPKIHVDFFIGKEHLNKAKNGQKVIVELLEWPEHARNPFAKVTQVLGEPGDHKVEIESIVFDYNFESEFPANVEADAAKIPNEVDKAEIKKRKDLRDTFTITIDPYDAKDFDDAISLKKLKDGLWEVGVHIADVSHFVRPGSAIEEEAYKRATSIYLVDRVIPMLPEKLSNQVCSLRPHEEKLAFSAIFTMNEEAEIKSEWFGKTVIKSDHRYSYEDAQQIIEGGEGPFPEEILKMNELSTKLRDKRFKRGSIRFHSTEVKFKLDEKSNPIGVYVKEQKEAHKLIEDFMLLANQKVAELIGKVDGKHKAKTFVYRVHDEPDPEKLNTFARFVSKLGYNLKLNNREDVVNSYNQLFKDIEGKGEKNMIETIAIRTMSKAYYSTNNIGHYGLSFPYYSHFTSPIRRYPDLMVHRLLQHYLQNGNDMSAVDYEEKCKHSSEMERNAAMAERASVKYMQAVYMADKVGQEFDGVISGVSKWGVYVEIQESKVEGMVRMKDMDDDFYFLDEENYQVIGQRHGKAIKLGDPVRIQVKAIHVQKKQLDFVMVND